jgi:hypothetical protein
MAAGLLFTIGSKGVKFTDEFYDVLRVMKGYKKGNHTRGKIYDSLLNQLFKNPDAKSGLLLRALQKELKKSGIDDKLRSKIAKNKKENKIDEDALENYKVAAQENRVIAGGQRKDSKYTSDEIIQRNRTRSLTYTKKALPFWTEVAENLDGTRSVVDVVQDVGGLNFNAAYNRLVGTSGWTSQGPLLKASDDPKVREMAKKIQREIDFYNRHKRAYEYVEPSKKTYIKKDQPLEENVIFPDGRPSAVQTKIGDKKFKGFIEPYHKIIGEHTMEAATRNKLERQVTDFAKQHGGYKEAAYITTDRRNKIKSHITKNILTNSIKKSELLNSIPKNQTRPSFDVLAQISKHDDAIAKSAKELEDLGLETAIYDTAANRGQGQIKYYGKPYDNASQLVQSLNKGVVPQYSGFIGPARPLPLRQVSRKVEGPAGTTVDETITTRKYNKGGMADKFYDFLQSTKDQFFQGGEYPYDVASNEPVGGDIESLVPTPDAVTTMTAPFTFEPVDKLVDESLARLDYDMITDNDVQQYLMSRDTALGHSNTFKQQLEFFNRQPSFFVAPGLEPIKENPMGLTEQEIIDQYQQEINSQRYKDGTRLYTSQEPEIVEKRKAIESRYFGNQLKKAGLLTANALIETYQAISPVSYAADAFEDIAEKKKGKSFYERELDYYKKQREKGEPYINPIDGTEIDNSTTIYDLFLPGMPQNRVDNFGEVERPDGYSVDEVDQLIAFGKQDSLRVPENVTKGDYLKSGGKFAMGVLPAFMGAGIRARLIDTINSKDIGKLSKFLKVAPQLMGFPTRKDMADFFSLVLKKMPKTYLQETFKKDQPQNLIALQRLVNDMYTDTFTENIDDYYANIRNELENPQYAEQREVLTNRLIDIYKNPDLVENVVDPNNYDKILKEAEIYEDMPEFVYHMAQVEANKTILKEKYEMLGKEPPELKTMQDDTLFEEATGIDLAPGERETPPSNIRNMAMGGDPGQFSDPLRTPDDSGIDVRGIQEETPYMSIDDLDLFEDANLKPTTENNLPPQVEMAAVNIFGKAPGWAVYLDKKSDIIKGGNQTKNLIRIGDEVAEATATTGEDVNRFYSNVEAKLLDPSVPDVFETPADLYNFFQSRNINKLEVEDYQLPQLFTSLFQAGQPVTKQVLLNRIKQAPIRKLKTKTFGFRSDIEQQQSGVLEPDFVNSKYGNQYYEKGSLPNSYREHVVYLDPSDIPGDPKSYANSTHDFFRGDEAYVVGWSRLTDRPAIVPGTSTQLSGDTTTKLLELEKKRDRLTSVTNKSAQDIVDQSGGRVSIEQAQKNIDNANKQLVKIQDDIDNFGSGSKQAIVNDQTVNVTFADEIQSDIFQTYRRSLQKIKQEYQRLVEKGVNLKDTSIIQRERQGDMSPELIKFYAKHKDILRPVFRTEDDFAGHILELQKSNAVFKDFANIRPGTLTPQDMVPIQEAAKKRDKVLEFFDQAVVSPETMRALFPNIPFKDRKAWGDVIVKNDLHAAAKRLFVENDPNAPTWYAISPAELVAKRYGQDGTTATALADRAGKKGVGTYEFYGGPDATDVSGKHYTSVLEQSLKRAANINNAEFKIIKVAVGDPRSSKKVIQIMDMNNQSILKTIRVKKDGLENAMQEATDFINSSDNAQDLYTKTTSIPSGFKTVDSYAIKLTPEMVLPSKTHLATGGLVKYDPLPNIEELIGVA